MYTLEKSILQHLTNGKSANYPMVKTLKLYAGELREDAKKFAEKVPAVFVMPMESNPLMEVPVHRADLLIFTKSDSFNINENQENNMQLAEQVVSYLGANPKWVYADLGWTVDTEAVLMNTAFIDNKFAMVIVSVPVANLY